MDRATREQTPISHPPRRRRLWPRLLLAFILVIILLPLAAAAVFYLTFDPNSYKGRIEAAASEALGRPVAIDGRIALAFSLTPHITADAVRIANLPGGSAPEMIRVASISTTIALLPLLHHAIEIDSLTLHQPSILLERTKDGAPNWVFTPEAAAPAPGAAAPAPAAPGAPVALPPAPGRGGWQVSVHAIRITDGTVTWQAGAVSRQVAIKTATVTAEGAAGTTTTASPLAFKADLLWQNQPVSLSGSTGPIAGFIAPAAGADWPVQAQLAAAGATLSVDGGFGTPAKMAGYRFIVTAHIPALEKLQPLLPPGLLPPGMVLPPLRQVAIGATVADAGAGSPVLRDLSLQAGNSDLGSLLPGLSLTSLALTTPGPDQPIALNLLGARQGFAFTLAGSTGPLAALLPPATTAEPAGSSSAAPAAAAQPGAPQPVAPQPVASRPVAPLAAPWPIDLQFTAGSSNLHLQGALADPAALRGLSLSISAQIARLDTLSPLLGFPLPPIPSLTGSALLRDGPEGLAHGLNLTGLNLTAPEGDLEGAIGLAFGKPLTVSADLRSAQLDLDGLFAPATPAAVAAAPGAPAATAPGAALPAPAPAPAPGPALVPAIPLPVGLLHAADGSVNLAFASLRLGGIPYRALVLHARLQNGVFALDPSSVVLPGGRVLVAVTVDARPTVPHVTLAFQAQSLAIAPLLAAFGLPPAAQGFADTFARLVSDGANTRALVADASGAIGLASVNSVVDGRTLAQLLAPAVHAAGVLPENVLTAAGAVPVHCLALRLDAVQGKARVTALLLDTSLMELQGQGTVDFGTESLDLALMPQLFLGEMDLTVPVSMTGPVNAPKFGRVGKLVISQQPGGGGGGGIGGFLQSVIGHGKAARHGVSPACGPALSLARNGQPGAGPADAASGRSLLNRPIDLFQQLLHGG
ncbi:AsmA family protein [Acidisoma sp. C75]